MVANGWQDIKLGEFVTLQRGHDLPEPQRSPGKIPVIGSFGITGYHDKATTKGPGVTVGRSGASFGVTNYSAIDFWALNTALYVIDFHGNDEKFAYYFLKSIDFQRYNSGSAQPSLNRNFIHPISVKIPPLAEQKTIAHILGTLDDKIELNQQMNQTLEAIARALFKSWFIDFDPVRAKLDGRQPIGMDAETAALFPAEFEDSPLGEIPKGWRLGKLKDISENPKRTIRPEQIPAGTPYIGLEHMPKKSIALFDWGLSDNVESNKFQFRQGDILFGKLRPYFHKVGVSIQDGVCSTDILVIIPKYLEWFSLTLAYVSSDEFVDYTNMASDGTRMPRTNWQVMGQYPIVIPSIEVTKAFNNEILLTVQAIRSNIFQSKTLASIRDALLPKLLSGEIRVQDAETVVEAVT